MKKVILAAAIAALAVPAPAFAIVVPDPTPTKSFSDANYQGYVEVDESGAVRACNENPNTPAGDNATGYVWVNANGEDTEPSYGNGTIGAGDADNDGVAEDGDDENGTETHDCP